MSNIFEKDLNGEIIESDNKDLKLILNRIYEVQKDIQKLNSKILKRASKLKKLSKIIGKKLPNNFDFLTPIYFDYGKNFFVGENTFINFGCSFLDRGGIYIGKNVLIGPNCNLMTTNHPIDPNKRKSTYNRKIVLEDTVWLGANVTIVPGVTIGKNSIIAAGSVVTKNIPENQIWAGNPAKFIRLI